MLTSKSPGAEVKIIDFGLAKLLDGDDKTASFLGTRVRKAAVLCVHIHTKLMRMFDCSGISCT